MAIEEQDLTMDMTHPKLKCCVPDCIWGEGTYEQSMFLTISCNCGEEDCHHVEEVYCPLHLDLSGFLQNKIRSQKSALLLKVLEPTRYHEIEEQYVEWVAKGRPEDEHELSLSKSYDGEMMLPEVDA